jgi:hypothetical protein
MGIGLPVEGEVWWRTEMGEEGLPQGVLGVSVATGVKPPMDCRPVPPMTAMWMGSGWFVSLGGSLRKYSQYRHSGPRRRPFCGSRYARLCGVRGGYGKGVWAD